MKVITENSILSISSDSENENYPIENVLNNSPKKKWLSADIVTQTVTVSVRAGSEAISFFNVGNVISISGVSEDSFNMEWGDGTQWGDGTEWGSIPNPGISFSLSFTSDVTAGWHDFLVLVENGTDITLTIVPTLYSFPQIGVISSGPKFTCADPSPGWEYGLIDYSIVTELSNGAFDSRDRDIVKSFSGSVYMITDTEFFVFSRLVRNNIKSNPRAWFFADKKNISEYIIYARLAGMPTAEMTDLNNSNKSLVEIELIEEV
jgi:hypothetical protein